ncbi:hypothetical protein LINPERHAP1_LOCUS1594, partial [Linum perenne]
NIEDESVFLTWRNPKSLISFDSRLQSFVDFSAKYDFLLQPSIRFPTPNPSMMNIFLRLLISILLSR